MIRFVKVEKKDGIVYFQVRNKRNELACRTWWVHGIIHIYQGNYPAIIHYPPDTILLCLQGSFRDWNNTVLVVSEASFLRLEEARQEYNKQQKEGKIK